MKKFLGFVLGAALGFASISFAQIIPSGGSLTITNVPGTPLTSVQFNSGSAFTGNAAFTYDLTNHAVKVNNDFYADVTASYPYSVRIGANDAQGYGATLVLESDGNDANNPAFLTFSSKGNMATPQVSTGTVFSRIHRGYDGSAFADSAFELVTISGAVTSGVVPGKVVYGVNKPGSGAASMTIDGNIPSAAFNVPVKASGYLSSDGSTGVTVTACTSFKNGLCVAGT